MENKKKRTILYYPTIEIKNPQWIRQMIFYWDEIGSIIPYELQEEIHQSDEIKLLHDSGLFRVFSPSEYVENFDKLTKEFISKHKKIERDQIIGNKWTDESKIFLVHRGKIPHELQDYFLRERVAKKVKKGYDTWFEMDTKYGMLYMSLLAKYLANQRCEIYNTETIPGTDKMEYADMVLGGKKTDDSLPGITFKINGILPIPREDVSLIKILRFKNNRRDELDKLRTEIDYLRKKLKKNISSVNDLEDILFEFSRDYKKDVENLNKAASFDKLSLIQSVGIDILTTEAGFLIPKITSDMETPIEIQIAGGIVAGSIGIGKYFLDKHNEDKKNLAASSFSYIALAKRKKLI
jgi:hypothetical protein